jgi:acyl-CoA thioesterase-1
MTLLTRAPSAAATVRDLQRVKTILVFGDSLSDGFRIERSQAYPALLTKKLSEARLEFEVLNASASGGTTEGGLRRLPPHLKRKIDILILELGITTLFAASLLHKSKAIFRRSSTR